MTGEIATTQSYGSDMDIIKRLKDDFMKSNEGKVIPVKVGEILKILEIQQKIAKSEDAQKELWKIIDQLRREVLQDEPSEQ
jgi:hypothetical protein